MYSGLPRSWRVVSARGVLAILFGLFALAQPGIALPLLVMGFGVAVLLSGILHIFAAMKLRRDMRDERVLIINGALTATFGVIALGLLVGASSLCFGLLLVVVSLRLRTRWLARAA